MHAVFKISPYKLFMFKMRGNIGVNMAIDDARERILKLERKY